MPEMDRRRFLQLAGVTGGVAAATSLTGAALADSVARAAAIPAHRRHGSLRDVEHVVILMQENRSFDHYFGTMRGVRGYGDPHPARQPSGTSVFDQNGVLPFRPDVDDLGLAFVQDLAHGWNDGHDAFHGGNYDRWVQAKTTTTMAHLERRDIPFHHALADAFTVCDGYHCSFVGSTDPNRYYLWTGWTGNDGRGKGPVLDNSEAGYAWTTYPERLERAGVSWRIYQDEGVGLDATGSWGWTEDPYIGNYGDNSLLYFDAYRNAKPGDALYEKARRGTRISAGGTLFDELRADVRNRRLPQVSWVAAPEAFTEHPNWPANYGAWYVSQVLDALTSDPDVWSRTVLLLTYDENDGFFDHVVPPYPAGGGLAGASTVPVTDEHFGGGGKFTAGAYGLGQRVPMLVVSPWSTGGWVCSETFDHTSVIRFLDARFGVAEPNITPWRRAVCGDLTSAFDFGRARARVPRLPVTTGYAPRDDKRHPDYVPTPPATGALPAQEPGVRPSRPLGYRLDVDGTRTEAGLRVEFHNRGRLGLQLQARSQTGGAPASFTVGAGDRLTATLPVSEGAEARYDWELHGPNGLYRRYAGEDGSRVEARLATEPEHVELVLRGSGTVTIRDAYRDQTRRVRLRGRASLRFPTHHDWYDLTVTGEDGLVRAFAGRVETGRPSISDPQLGR